MIIEVMNKKVAVLLFIYLSLLCSCSDNEPKQHESINSQHKQLNILSKLYHNKKIDSCIKEAKEFTNKYPDNDTGWQLLSSAYLTKKKYSKSKLFAIKSLSINPKNHIALVNMGILLDKKKHYSKAKKYYDSSIKVQPIPQAYSNYAGNRLYSGEYDISIKYAKKAIKMANKISDKGVLCLAYHKAGQKEKRDSLYNELKRLKYEHLSDLKQIFNK